MQVIPIDSIERKHGANQPFPVRPLLITAAAPSPYLTWDAVPRVSRCQ